jgi:hypothetical protein
VALAKMIPIILIFGLGFGLKKIGFLKKEDADLLLRIVFFLTLPSLILLSVVELQLTPQLAKLPLIAVIVILFDLALAYLTARTLRLDRKAFGVFLVGSMVMNTVFAIPFVIALMAKDGFSRLILFDFGNALLAFTLAYYIACYYGGTGASAGIARKVLTSPSLWAFFVGLVFNSLDLTIRAPFLEFFDSLGKMTGPLTMLSLGIYFTPKATRLLPLVCTIAIRMLFGLLAGYGMASIFHLRGIDLLVVLIGSSTPSGYVTLAYASLEKLDTEFASSVISFSMVIGLFLIPLLVLVL